MGTRGSCRGSPRALALPDLRRHVPGGRDGLRQPSSRPSSRRGRSASSTPPTGSRVPAHGVPRRPRPRGGGPTSAARSKPARTTCRSTSPRRFSRSSSTRRAGCSIASSRRTTACSHASPTRSAGRAACTGAPATTRTQPTAPASTTPTSSPRSSSSTWRPSTRAGERTRAGMRPRHHPRAPAARPARLRSVLLQMRERVEARDDPDPDPRAVAQSPPSACPRSRCAQSRSRSGRRSRRRHPFRPVDVLGHLAHRHLAHRDPAQARRFLVAARDVAALDRTYAPGSRSTRCQCLRERARDHDRAVGDHDLREANVDPVHLGAEHVHPVEHDAARTLDGQHFSSDQGQS
jgi:hypothetical protein